MTTQNPDPNIELSNLRKAKNEASISIVSPFLVHSSGYVKLIKDQSPEISVNWMTTDCSVNELKACDLVIFQFGSNYDSQLETLLHLRDSERPTRILAILEEPNEYLMRVLAQFKIEGIMLLESVQPRTLQSAIERILEEEAVYLDSALVANLMKYYQKRDLDLISKKLTHKQLQIVTLSGQGYTSIEISRIVNSSRSNITQLKTRIYEILGVRNMYMAIIKCLMERTISLDSLIHEIHTH